MWIRSGSTWTHPDLPYLIRYRPAEGAVVGTGADQTRYPDVEIFEVRLDGELVAIRWTLEAAQRTAEERWADAARNH